MLESGPCRARWDPKNLGDLGRRIAGEVEQDEDRPLIWRQPAETSLELVTQGDRQGFIVRCGTIDRQLPQVGDPPALAGRGENAGPHDQATQPGVEPIGLSEAREVLPGSHERLLESVLGGTAVAKDPVGDGKEPSRPRADEVHERPVVATPCSVHDPELKGAKLLVRRRADTPAEGWKLRTARGKKALGGYGVPPRSPVRWTCQASSAPGPATLPVEDPTSRSPVRCAW